MKTRTKTLTLSIEFDDKQEAIRCIEKIVKHIQLSRTNYGRELFNGCLYQWGISHNELEKYRVELIDGKECIVIPSKMNNDV